MLQWRVPAAPGFRFKAASVGEWKAQTYLRPQPLFELHCIFRSIYADRWILRDVAGNLVAVLEYPQLLQLFNLLQAARRKRGEFLQQISSVPIKPEVLQAWV